MPRIFGLHLRGPVQGEEGIFRLLGRPHFPLRGPRRTITCCRRAAPATSSRSTESRTAIPRSSNRPWSRSIRACGTRSRSSPTATTCRATPTTRWSSMSPTAEIKRGADRALGARRLATAFRQREAHVADQHEQRIGHRIERSADRRGCAAIGAHAESPPRRGPRAARRRRCPRRGRSLRAIAPVLSLVHDGRTRRAKGRAARARRAEAHRRCRRWKPRRREPHHKLRARAVHDSRVPVADAARHRDRRGACAVVADGDRSQLVFPPARSHERQAAPQQKKSAPFPPESIPDPIPNPASEARAWRYNFLTPNTSPTSVDGRAGRAQRARGEGCKDLPARGHPHPRRVAPRPSLPQTERKESKVGSRRALQASRNCEAASASAIRAALRRHRDRRRLRGAVTLERHGDRIARLETRDLMREIGERLDRRARQSGDNVTALHARARRRHFGDQHPAVRLLAERARQLRS